MRFLLAGLSLLSVPLLSVPVVSVPMPPGLKIAVRSTGIGSQPLERTEYVQGDRRRIEQRGSQGMVYGPWIATITRCDLGQMFDLNLADREYEAHPIPKFPTLEERRANAAKQPKPSKPPEPNLRIEIKTVDTGERKQIFGYAARHVITTTKETPLGSLKRDPSESVRDGWYIDLDRTISCDQKRPDGNVVAFGFATVGGSGTDIPVPTASVIGKQETGYPVQLKITAHTTRTLADGTKKEFTNASETRVTELSSGPLDPALFEVPRGFRQVDAIKRNPPVPFLMQWRFAWQRWRVKLARMFD